jgi:hypothetical protein
LFEIGFVFFEHFRQVRSLSAEVDVMLHGLDQE